MSVARRALRSGLAGAGLLWARARPQHAGLRILMYHRVAPLPGFDQLTVSPARFDEQAAWLAAHAHVLPLDEALDRLHDGGLPPNAVALTFDDGYRDNLVHALPVLKRHGLPATVFVTTAFCDQRLRHPRYDGEGGRLHLDWDEVRQLAAQPGIGIGSHTETHPRLPRTDAARAWREIAGSRHCIAQQLGRAPDLFCYPAGDFGERDRRLARDAGYRAAVSVAPGLNRRGGDPLRLHRTEVTDRDGPQELALKLRGAFDPLHGLLHAWRRGRFAVQDALRKEG